MSEKWYPGAEDDDNEDELGGSKPEDEQWFFPPPEESSDLFDKIMEDAKDSRDEDEGGKAEEEDGIFSNLGETAEEPDEDSEGSEPAGEEAQGEESSPQAAEESGDGDSESLSEGAEEDAEEHLVISHEPEAEEGAQPPSAEEEPAAADEEEPVPETDMPDGSEEEPIEVSSDDVHSEGVQEDTEPPREEADPGLEEELPVEEGGEEAGEEPAIDGEADSDTAAESAPEADPDAVVEAAASDLQEEPIEGGEGSELKVPRGADSALEEEAGLAAESDGTADGEFPAEEEAAAQQPDDLAEADPDAPQEGQPFSVRGNQLESEADEEQAAAETGAEEDEASSPSTETDTDTDKEPSPEDEPASTEEEPDISEAEEAAEAEEEPEEIEDNQAEQPDETSGEEIAKMLEDEQATRLKELDRIRQKVDSEFQIEESRQNAPANTEAGTKGVEDYMVDLDTLNMGLLVHYLSKRRDKKLGREIEATKKDVEKLKGRQEQAHAAEQAQSASDEIKALEHDQDHDKQITIERIAEDGKLEEQMPAAEGSDKAPASEIIETGPAKDIPTGEAERESLEAAYVSADEEQNIMGNQELSGSESKAPDAEQEEVRVETLARQNEIKRQSPQEEAFDTRQEKISQPKDDATPAVQQDYSPGAAVPISDILTAREKKASEFADTDEQSARELAEHKAAQAARAAKYKTSITVGFAAGLGIIGMIIIYLLTQ